MSQTFNIHSKCTKYNLEEAFIAHSPTLGALSKVLDVLLCVPSHMDAAPELGSRCIVRLLLIFRYRLYASLSWSIFILTLYSAFYRCSIPLPCLRLVKNVPYHSSLLVPPTPNSLLPLSKSTPSDTSIDI